MTPRLIAAVCSVVALVIAAACSDSPTGPSGTVVPGVWGGDHVSLTVADRGHHLEFDCAHGDIPGPLITESRGQFAVPGIFVRERGGPVREGDPPDAHSATYVGTLAGRTMRLTVRLAQNNELIGTFTLTSGAPGRVVKCL